MTDASTHSEGQQHPLGIYIKIWMWLFVLSTASYMVDYLHVEGYLRWTLILIFMMLKAGLIISVFIHMMWERLALLYAIFLPPFLVLVFVGMMVIESDNTFGLRSTFFSVFTGS